MAFGRRAVAFAVAGLLLAVAPTYAATDTVAPLKPEPVLVVKSFKTNPVTLVVGARFKLELSLDNEVDVKADNVVITVGASAVATQAPSTTTSAAPGPNVVVLGSNTRFLGAISASETSHAVAFDLVSNPNGSPGPFSVPVTIQFDSPNGGRVTSVQSVGLMFTRTLVFDVGALTYPRQATAGVPFDLSVSVANTNDFAINGVALSFEATGVAWTSHETTVGVLEPGKTARLVARGAASVPGTLPVTMAISYKDDYNQLKQIKREITVLVLPKPAVAPVAAPRDPLAALWLFAKALVGIGG